MKKLTFIILMVLTTFLLATPALGYEPMVPIPGAGEITDINDYIKALYLFGLAIVGVVAMLFIIIGGIRYMTAAGNEAGISEAKSQITSAILGLVLVLTSWLILHTINPELVSLKKLTVEPVNQVELPSSTKQVYKCVTNNPNYDSGCVTYEACMTGCKNLPGGHCVNKSATDCKGFTEDLWVCGFYSFEQNRFWRVGYDVYRSREDCEDKCSEILESGGYGDETPECRTL